MNHLRLLLFLLALNSYGQKQKLKKSILILPPKQVVTIDYPYYQGYMVKLWNKGKFALGVSARDKKNDSLKKGLELAKGGQTTFGVNTNMYLQLENRFFAPLKVEYVIYKGKAGKKKASALRPQRAFYLVNTTGQMLPLKIPGKMNPQLTPYSKIGVDLPFGQKILLRMGDKDLPILTVSDTIRKGARIDVADLIDRALNAKK